MSRDHEISIKKDLDAVRRCTKNGGPNTNLGQYLTELHEVLQSVLFPNYVNNPPKIGVSPVGSSPSSGPAKARQARGRELLHLPRF